jgi:nucleoside 2-deoxyribosyltransferase
MLIYLAGCMSEHDRKGCFEKATSWRKTATKELSHTEGKMKLFDPCDNYTFNKEYNPKGVVNQNLAYLKNTDVILVNLEEIDKSPGTLFEIFYGYMNHIPIISFGESYLYDSQPHITESISMHFEEIYGATDYILSMFSQDNH